MAEMVRDILVLLDAIPYPRSDRQHAFPTISQLAIVRNNVKASMDNELHLFLTSEKQKIIHSRVQSTPESRFCPSHKCLSSMPANSSILIRSSMTALMKGY